jgi:uncharacterized membrane protein YeaQ/YmgE (transglycosylase-associated protein family)
MDIVGLIINLISGAVGGNVAGGLLKDYNLGTLGDSIAGIVGGAAGGQILSMLMGGAAAGGAGAGIWTSLRSSPMSPVQASAERSSCLQ